MNFMKNGRVWKVTVTGHKQAHSANDIEDELMISISYSEKFKYVPKKYIYGNYIWCVHPHTLSYESTFGLSSEVYKYFCRTMTLSL